MKTMNAAFLTLMLFVAIDLHGQAASDAKIAAGQKLFARHCSGCHGAEGFGTKRAPSISSFVRTANRASLQSFVKNGNLRRGMPSWSRLPDQRLDQIAAYLKSLDSQER